MTTVLPQVWSVVAGGSSAISWVAVQPASILSASAVGLSAECGPDEAYARAEEIWAQVYRSADAQEGPAAFRDKRAPVWTGRQPMPVSMAMLADDLAAESAELRRLVSGLDEAGWRRDTPAEGWTIADQVSHLAHFDAAAVRSAVEPDEFRAELERIEAEGGVDPDAIAARYRHMRGTGLLAWFDEERSRLVTVFSGLDPALRVPWFATEMSAASSLTARIMETWAHGQDVADAVGVRREPTVRLRHVAHIGVGARAFSYELHGRELPDAPVRVELAAPDGSTWSWGPQDAANRVTGPVLDFALAITQRRHHDDLALEITGPHAREWMEIGQAFAGAPGTGRMPGFGVGAA